jgi:DNA transformation protein
MLGATIRALLAFTVLEMSTSASTMEFLLDQLRHAGPVSSRKMFGEYCLYFDGTPVGLVCDDQLYLKPTAEGRALLAEPREGCPFPGAKPHLLLDADAWEDAQTLCLLVRTTALALPVRPPPKPKLITAKKPGSRSDAKDLASLPNLGPKSSAMLAAAGITSTQQLRKLGAVAAFAKVKKTTANASLNLLWALEGALSQTPWHVVAREHRTSLLLALEHLQKQTDR